VVICSVEPSGHPVGLLRALAAVFCGISLGWLFLHQQEGHLTDRSAPVALARERSAVAAGIFHRPEAHGWPLFATGASGQSRATAPRVARRCTGSDPRRPFGLSWNEGHGEPLLVAHEKSMSCNPACGRPADITHQAKGLKLEQFPRDGRPVGIFSIRESLGGAASEASLAKSASPREFAMHVKNDDRRRRLSDQARIEIV
jgi:hypothetical protein